MLAVDGRRLHRVDAHVGRTLHLNAIRILMNRNVLQTTVP